MVCFGLLQFIFCKRLMEEVSSSNNDAHARVDESPLMLHRKPKKRTSGASSDAADRAALERDESEFVSVEVGMRELHRRLAGRNRSSTTKSSASRASTAQPMAKAPQKAQLPQPVAAAGDASLVGSKQPAKRARPAKPAASAPHVTTTPNANAPATKWTAGNANTKTDVKPKPKAKAPAKPRAPRRPTIAEIRAELLREQQERVETRIQTLHCVNCNSVTHTAESHVHSPETPRVLVHSRSGRPHPLVSPSPLLLPGTGPVALPELHVGTTGTTTGPTLLVVLPTAAGGALLAPDLPTSNEFIDDDFDEDMAFMLALDQVERSLTTPTKPPPPSRTLAAATMGRESPVASQFGTQPLKTESQALSQVCFLGFFVRSLSRTGRTSTRPTHPSFPLGSDWTRDVGGTAGVRAPQERE